jgi:glycosyltransferase involved in cell wall biosynthesis
VVRLLKDADLRLRMGEAARQTALAEFNVDAMKRKTLELYEEAAAKELSAVS